MKDKTERHTVELNLINQGINGLTNRGYIMDNTWALRNIYANRIKVRNGKRLMVIDLQSENRFKL